ncbi:MAG: hypothetical protein QJR08_00345 [Bacillota bacterium]|nr:hypothetical protein [Bacillota bacterium]
MIPSAEELLRQDMRLARRILAAFLALIMLPWMFLQSSWSFPRYPVREPVPMDVPVAEPAPAAEPVPQGYPVTLTWTPVPLSVLWDWVQRNYPDTVLTPADIAAIDAVAHKWNVSTELLFGILVAEQGFLSPSRVGLQHALEFHANPFDYGVYPGSPFPFAIGVEKSAEGAASIVARTIEAYPAGNWDQTTWLSFWAALSGVYVNGDVHKPATSWIKNVATTMRQVWQTINDHADEVAQHIKQSYPSFVQQLANGIQGLSQSLGVAKKWIQDHKGLIGAVIIGALAITAIVGLITGQFELTAGSVDLLEQAIEAGALAAPALNAMPKAA